MPATMIPVDLIKKYRIVKNAEDEIVRTSERGNPYMGIEIPEFCEYDGTEDFRSIFQ